MNKIYKVVWSKAKHCYVVTSELAKRQTKGCGARSLRMATVSLCVAAALLCSGAVLPIFGESVAEAAVTVNDAANPTASAGIVEYPLESTLGFKVYTTNSTDKEVNIIRSEDNSKSAKNGFVGVFEMASSTESPKGTVNLNNGVTVGAMIGGGSYSGDVANHAVKVISGTVDIGMYGGFAYSGKATGNSIEISGDSTVINYNSASSVSKYSKVAGGDGKTGASNNTVTIKGGTINNYVYGGYSENGVAGGSTAAEGNKINIEGGTVNKTIYGGYSGSNAIFNEVTISGGEVLNSTVIGGLGSSTGTGEASRNTVTVSKGTVEGTVKGGAAGNTTNYNIVTISGGKVTSVIGADNYGQGENPLASFNEVTIKETAQVTNDVYGAKWGYGSSAIADNTVTIDGSAVVGGNVFGGDSRGGESSYRDETGNKVYIKNGSSVTGDVYGARLYGGSSNKGNVKSNEVHISNNAKITGSVYGGSIVLGTGDVKGNIVEVTGGTINEGNNEGKYVYGGYSVSNSVGGSEAGDGNKVIVSGGEVKSTVLGGYSKTAAAMGNSVEVSGEGKVTSSVYGGYSSSGTAGGDGTNDGNKVIVNGGEVQGAVTGGYSKTAAAKGNSVEISGGKVGLNAEAASYIYGGFSNQAAATGNKVSISNGTAGENYSVQIFGGYSDSGAADSNEVTLGGGTIGNSGKVSYVYGGRGKTSASGNMLNITDGTLNNGVIYGGFSNSTADNNIVDMSGGTLPNTSIHGGRGGTSASGNQVTVRGGHSGYVYGGVAWSNAGKMNQNEVTIKGKDTVVSGVYGGYDGAENNGNKVSIQGSTVNNYVYGGNSSGGGAVQNNEVTISDATVKSYVFGGASHKGLISKNTVTIINSTIGGSVFGGEQYDRESGTDYTVAGNIVTVKGGTFTADKKIYGGFTYSGSTTDNIINLTGSTTGLEGVEVYGGSQSANTGNELHVGGTKTYDGSGNLVTSVGDAWQGSSNNTVKTVANFETIALHSVVWNPEVAALAATTVDNIGTLDIKDMQFDKTPSNGESMALLKAENDLGVVGIGLAYKDGSTEKTATSAELAAGVTFDSGALTDTAVNGVSVTGTQDKKVSLENSNKEIRYSFSSTITGITIATNTYTADGTARTFGKGDNLTGATYTNNLAFSDESKKNMVSGQSMVILDATNAVAVEGATLPAFTSASYDVNFSDAIDGKVVTLSGTHTDTLALNSSNTQLTYTVGDMQVSGAKFDGNVTWDNSESYYTADTKYKFSGTTNIDAMDLTVTGTSTNALQVGNAMTLLSAEGMTANIEKDQSETNKAASKITVNFNDATTNGIALVAEATGKVVAATGAVNYEVTGVEIQSVDLAGWTGTASDVQSKTTGWTVKSGASITTGDLAKAGLDTMNPGEVKPILTADTKVKFNVATITGDKAWKDGGDFDEGTHESGVVVKGSTTGGGVKADDTNKNVLVYQKDKNTISGITLGSVAFTKDGTVRKFDNSYDLTGAGFTTTDFAISNATTATMNTGDTMVVVDATDAIKSEGKEKQTLKDFTKQNAGKAIAFSEAIDGKALTLSGTHQDTLEQNADKNQILYKVGDKNVNKATFTGEVAWSDSEAYYTNDGTKYKFNGATDVDATNLKVTGTSTKALKNGDAMTLLSADGMTVGTVTPQSDANKSASKIGVNFTDAKGIQLTAEAMGEVKASDNTVNYEVTGVTLTGGNLSGWMGTDASTVPEGWTAGSVAIETDGMTAPSVEPGGHKDILQSNTDNFFKDANINGENEYKATDFTEKDQEITFVGTQDKGVTLNEKKNHIIYAAGAKNVKTATMTGEIAWSDGGTYYTNEKYTFNENSETDVSGVKFTSTSDPLNTTMTLIENANGKVTGTPDFAVKLSNTTLTAKAAGNATTGGNLGFAVTGVTLDNVTVSGTGSDTVPAGWTATSDVTVDTESMTVPTDVAAGTATAVLSATDAATFANSNIKIEGKNSYLPEAFINASDTSGDASKGVTVAGTQSKGVLTAEDALSKGITTTATGKNLVYAVSKKDSASITLGKVDWVAGTELLDGSSTDYNYGGVDALASDGFEMNFASPETVDATAGESMTLLKANETLKDMAEQVKQSSYSYNPVSGVTVDAAITGKLTTSSGVVTYTPIANQASKLTFTNVEWKDSGALMTRPANITFAGADVDTAKINFHNIQELAANSRMTLVSDFGETVGTITGDTFTVGSGLKGEGAASLSGTDLIFTAKTGAESLTPTEATHETVMAMEAGTAVVAAGREYVDSAVEGLGLVSNMAPDGTSTFASMGGGVGRYKTGSHVDTHTWSAVVAVGSKREHKKGNLEWGVFAEYGRGNYTLHDDNGGRGDGNTNYAGGGLLAKWTNKHDVYTEASVRMGRMSDSASNMLRDVLGNMYGYDVHANYFGAHVGLGKIIKVKKNRDLDVYGKYFYLRRNGVNFDAGGNHYTLDSVTSSLLRVGARYGSNDKKWNWYGGLAYEYEFDGQSKGNVDGLAIRSASIKGGSVRGEIGMRMEATKTNPWKVDISIYGYGGKHRGFGGNVSVAYMF